MVSKMHKRRVESAEVKYMINLQALRRVKSKLPVDNDLAAPLPHRSSSTRGRRSGSCSVRHRRLPDMAIRNAERWSNFESIPHALSSCANVMTLWAVRNEVARDSKPRGDRVASKWHACGYSGPVSRHVRDVNTKPMDGSRRRLAV